ncbi:MAG: folate-binding protein [Pseudomonadota bacterium]
MTLTNLSDRAVLSVSGSEARAFLQGLITQDVSRLDAGAIFACLLTPQGKILFDFFIAPAGSDETEKLLVDVAAESADALLKRLKLYKLRAKVEIALADDLAVYWSPEAAESLDGALCAFADPRHAGLGRRIIADPGAAPAGDDYASARIGVGAPEAGADFNADDVFPLDVNFDALNAVDYKKGCFVGQEVASRMKRKGEARKRTLIALFDGAPPAPGAAVTADGSTLGRIMSGVEGRALALIRLDRLARAVDANHAIEADGKALRLTRPGYLADG